MLYHGTDHQSAWTVLKSGFKAGVKRSWGGSQSGLGVYLSTSFEHASAFAMHEGANPMLAQKFGGSVLVVNLDVTNPKMLMDEDSIWDPFVADFRYPETKQFLEHHYPGFVDEYIQLAAGKSDNALAAVKCALVEKYKVKPEDDEIFYDPEYHGLPVRFLGNVPASRIVEYWHVYTDKSPKLVRHRQGNKLVQPPTVESGFLTRLDRALRLLGHN